DDGCLATTMVDYYALPKDGPKGWPGRLEAEGKAFSEKALTVQQALRDDINAELGDGFDVSRFLPYVMMHEFEGLLFSDCTLFAKGIGRPELGAKFQEIRSSFSSPEEINDSPLTAPSKRVEDLVPGYEKPLLGSLAVLEIGLENIRSECPH